MQAGRLHHRIRIEVDVGTATSDDGQHIPDWQPLAGQAGLQLPCGVRTVAGGEVIRGVQVQALMTHVIELRYRSDVRPKHRAVWIDYNLATETVLPIEYAIDPDGRRESLFLQCQQAVN